MRNIYKSYQLCQRVYKNLSHHKCDDSKCPLSDVVGVEESELVKKERGQSEGNETVYKYFFWAEYAREKNYVKPVSCSAKGGDTYITLTTQGTDLIDSVWVVPTGLIIEVIKQHKVFISVVGILLYLWSRGITLNRVLESIADKL